MMIPQGRLKTGTELDTLLPGSSAHPKDAGIAYSAAMGLFGVISGTAGSGKSVLSLQLCCRFATERKVELNLPAHAIYVTQERPEAIKMRAQEFGNFQTEDEQEKGAITIYDEEQLYALKNSKAEQGQSTVTIVHMPLNAAAQKDKLSSILGFLNRVFCCKKNSQHGTRNDPKTRLLLCLDNADTISDEAYRYVVGANSEAARTERKFYKAIREYCAQHRLNSWLVFEELATQGAGYEETNIATDEVAYAADIVIRLGLTVFETQYRERSIEIVKAKNQGYRRGRHHFSIRDQAKVRYTARKPGIIIFPSLATRLFELGGHDRKLVTKQAHAYRHYLGIVEVDRAVCRANSWLPGGKSNALRPYLASGTVSVLVSDLDSLASELALHFALQEGIDELQQQKPAVPVPTLFITTLHNKDRLEDMAGLYHKIELQMKAVTQSSGTGAFKIKELDSDHVTDGKLLRDITDWIGSLGPMEQPKRIVLDNIFEIKAKFPLIRDPKHFLNALFVLFRKQNITALVIDTVEVGEGRNPLDQSFAAGIADHVFVLRHTESQSRPRKIFTVLKLAGHEEPHELWEIKKDMGRAYAQDLSRSFKGVLSGRLEPVSVNLSLYADAPNSPLDEYLKAQSEVLIRIFSHNVNFHACRPTTYVAMQNNIASAGIHVLGDCHVISIDEIWLEALIRQGKLEEIPNELLGDLQEFAHSNYVTAGEDLALACIGEKYRSRKDRPSYAIPDRNNVGVLAFNPSAWDAYCDSTGRPGCVNLESWRRIKHICNWIRPSKAIPPPSWEELVELQTLFVKQQSSRWNTSRYPTSMYRMWEEGVTAFEAARTPRGPRTVKGMENWGVFTLTMDHREPVVSFLLELVLSQLKVPEDFFCADGEEGVGKGLKSRTLNFSRESREAWTNGLWLMMRLLSPWDLMRLADAWFRPSAIERPCLFSRQWFSTAGIIGLRSPGLSVMELPAGKCGKPVPVSGAWYLGILKGSTALGAGTAIIQHLASRNEELYKVKRMVGLPQRSDLFKSAHPMEVRSILPYKDVFMHLEGAPRKCWKRIDPNAPMFYRGRIRFYQEVSSQVLGLIVQAAKIATCAKHENWLWQRDEFTGSHIRIALEQSVNQMVLRYHEFLHERQSRLAAGVAK